MTKPSISRKRIMELMNESTTEPYRFDDDWINRFMTRLHEETPTVAAAVKQLASERLKEKK